MKEFQPFKARAGHVLFRPEQDCPGFVRLKSGTLRVSITAANGREVVLYRVRPGDVCLQTFSCLYDGRTYSAEGVAESDIDGEMLTPDAFRRGLAEDEAFRNWVLGAVARRFAAYEQLVEDLALTGFDARLAKVLLVLRDEAGDVHATHQNLAAETASGRAFVSRRLAEFARHGLVALERGRVHILDEAGLGQIAADKG